MNSLNRRSFLLACGSAQAATPTRGPLRPHPGNPRYFAGSDGQPVFLAGSHTWNNLQDSGVARPSPFPWNGYLRMMLGHNHNFLRLWSWEHASWATWSTDKVVFEPTAYLRTGPGQALDGGQKFDLSRFNPAYFDRLRQRVADCRDRGIYAAVMLFQGFSGKRRSANHCGDPWPGHPYNRANNINGVDGEKSGDSSVDLASAEVRRLQVTYLRKVVDTVNAFDNVLYEVINEGGNPEWDAWVVNTVHQLERGKGIEHPVGVTGQGGTKLSDMLSGPADWIAPGISDVPLYKTDPPAWDGRKVSVLDTDHIWGHGGTASWVWKSFCRGYNVLLMDAWDPIAGTNCPSIPWDRRPGAPGRNWNRAGDPAWEPVRQAMGKARSYAARLDLASAIPAGDLASTGFCLAKPGHQYLAYLPEGDEVTLDLGASGGEFQLEWLNVAANRIENGGAVAGGKRQRLLTPFVGPAVLFASIRR